MITLQNYYDPKSRYLTRSKIMTYMQSPALFKQYWIDNLKPEKAKSAAFKVGGAVDDILAQTNNIDNYAVFDGDARTKEGKEYKQSLLDAGKEIISRAQYDEIIELADAVNKTSAYQDIKDWEKQKVLHVEQKIGKHFDGLAGLPDFISFNKDTSIVDIVDLKTSRTINPKAYAFHCLEYGYYLQAALYCYLAKKTYPEANKIRFWHLVVEKSDAYNVAMFMFDKSLISSYEEYLLSIVEEIGQDKDFKKVDASFEKAILLTA